MHRVTKRALRFLTLRHHSFKNRFQLTTWSVRSGKFSIGVLPVPEAGHTSHPKIFSFPSLSLRTSALRARASRHGTFAECGKYFHEIDLRWRSSMRYLAP